MENSYVYITLDKTNGEVMYIGSGVGKRLNHVLSGRSSSVNANRAVLINGGNYETVKFVENLSKDCASQVEAALIYALQPAWNKKGLLEEPDVSHELLFNSLRMKAHLDFVKYHGVYSDVCLAGIIRTCLFVFCKAEFSNVGKELTELYPLYDKLVTYFLEEGEWLTYHPKV